MANLLAAVASLGLDAVCVHPNSDRGHSGILAAIDDQRRRTPPGRFRVVRSLPSDEFLSELIRADVLVGNSSSGMIEAATAGTPAVNVGNRQKGRDCDERFVIHSDESAAAIQRAIRRALKLRPVMGQSRGKNSVSTGVLIARHLAAMPLTEAYRRKIFADLPTS